MKQTISAALARKGYDRLTPVQSAVIAPELEAQDMLVSAETGSGKTVAFGLAIAPTLLGDQDTFDRASAPVALIVTPTRELAMQVKRELAWLYNDARGKLASCVGGMDMRDERRALARGAHMVVATPGRLRDHIVRGSIDLTHVRAVVLDEADEMLDLGFREDLEFILEQTPAERQTLLFSATVPSAIAKLAQKYQNKAQRISTVAKTTQHADIDYRAAVVAASDGENAVINLLRFYEAPNAIVFCNTRAMVARLTSRLSNRGFSVVALSGELTQAERSNALQAMRDGRARVCVATDVAARGIDLPKLDLVIHAELPNSHETLLHRSGRTGRAGRKGVSALVVTPASRKKAERTLKFAKVTATWGPAPSAAEIDARDHQRMMDDPTWSDPVTDAERATVDELLATFSPDQLAAALLRQLTAQRSAPEDLVTVSVEAPAPRKAFGPSVWFSISEGRKQAASPRHLLPMICTAGGITKLDIGEIRIADNQSYVEISEAAVPVFLDALGPDMLIEGDKTVTQLDGAPDVPKHSPRKGRFTPGSKPRAPRYDKPKSKRPPRPDHPKDTKLKDAAPSKPKSKPRPEPHKAAPADTDAKPPRKKGPPPPKGKPSSKKNRARAAVRKQNKGGNAMPKRRKT